MRPEGIRIRHAKLRGCTAIVKVPDYGPRRVTKALWLRLDLNGEVIVTEPTWRLLQQHTPGEWELLNTVLHPPTQRVSQGGPGSATDAAAEAHRQQQAEMFAAWRAEQAAKDAAIRRAVVELAPPGAAGAHVTQGGLDPTRDRQRIALR